MSLPAQVEALLGAHGVPPELLNLEVTETAIITEPGRAQQVLEQMSALGIRISIDDFGAGYTSLGFTLVAEGVETQQILTTLDRLGCDVAQGYHLSRPITAVAFDTWCAGRRITPTHLPAVVSH